MSNDQKQQIRAKISKAEGKPAHMSDWPMSSRVAEAVRYLQEEHNGGR